MVIPERHQKHVKTSDIHRWPPAIDKNGNQSMNVKIASNHIPLQRISKFAEQGAKNCGVLMPLTNKSTIIDIILSVAAVHISWRTSPNGALPNDLNQPLLEETV